MLRGNLRDGPQGWFNRRMINQKRDHFDIVLGQYHAIFREFSDVLC